MLTKIELAREFCARLEKIYPDAQCALEAGGEAWKLLIMGRLSAQCTDARVNIVCRELFEVYPSAEAIADADLASLEEIVRPCGLYKTKAKNIKDACRMLVDDYHGVLPDTMEELLTFPGVGRKIANLLLGDVYHKPAIVTDTHCIRICGRIGLYPELLKDPAKVEKILVPLIEPEKSSDFCHRLVIFGRDTCTARSPSCTAPNGANCPMADICAHYKQTN
ncbi:MAG: endonuclease III [Clostridia bacterium]|nr:endonuclease III [Clostridia bacterium]